MEPQSDRRVRASSVPSSSLRRLSNSSTISLEFVDSGTTLFENAETETITFPPVHDFLPSVRNGSAKSQWMHHLKSPGKAANMLTRAVKRQVQPGKWIVTIKETTCNAIAAKLEKALEGHDAVQMFNKTAALVPAVRIPSQHTVDRMVDRIADDMQDLFVRKPSTRSYRMRELEGAEFEFARIMGKKARDAIVHQGICKPYQVMPCNANLREQHHLNLCLAHTYENLRELHTFMEMLELKPVWIGIPELNTWRLKLQMEVTEIIFDGEEVDDVPLYLETGFEFQGQEDWASVKDYCRGTVSVEAGDWEAVEV
ncbi:hypothetical protein EJ04DRAFT_560383 [Polyplosphaeria fusca]|uniref:Uncharacterized protein n=1 Tax=Polyplosphaeria fusca TaxID=682080 RepID=A0A9P4V6V3_9PLEO|nr:hypothetical protein EJ04DRAFT_560383 [Polyplosphaeria fusca]